MIQVCKAFLLRKNWTPGDHALLEFFTDRWGKITVQAPKLANSSKRQSHLDFFRLLECTIKEQGTRFQLQECQTLFFFSQYTDSYALNQAGFCWLELLQKKLPEQKVWPSFFQTFLFLFSQASTENYKAWEAFLRIKIFDEPCPLPRFDQVRSDTYLCPQTLEFSIKPKNPDSIFLKNITRQLFEFIRRSDEKTFSESLSRISTSESEACLEIIKNLETFH